MNALWQNNLLSLESRPEPLSLQLAQRLRTAGPWQGTAPTSRRGLPLPSVEVAGRQRALESAFDAAREAELWAGDLPREATIVVVGGAAPALWGAVLNREPALAVAWEPRLEVWQNLMTVCDFTGPLQHLHWIPVCAEADKVLEWLGRRYHPLWDGGITIRLWRAATEGSPGDWEAILAQGKAALETWSGDFSTQARFGARWYRNTLRNLRQLAPLPKEGLPWLKYAPEAVIVAGAGPHLEACLESPQAQRALEGRPGNRWLLLATDTALPALLHRGWIPDAVLVLDGQVPSAQHFHPPLPQGLPLVADLGSLTLFHRLGLTMMPFLSGNPLAAVVRRHFPGIPQLTVATGNVSGLGWELAAILGARQTHVWGVDLSYPDAKGYARGTYVYAQSERRSTRLRPGESLLTAGCYAAPGLEQSQEAPIRYTTELLRHYRRQMQNRSLDLATTLVSPPEPGMPHFSDGRGSSGLPGWTSASTSGDWEGLQLDWRRRLGSLPRLPSGARMTEWLGKLEPSRQQDWLALWPLALAVQRVHGTSADWHDRLVQTALEPLLD